MREKLLIFGGSPSYRRKLLFIALAMVVGIGSLLFSNKVVRQLASKERSEIRLWSHAMAMMGDTDMHDSRGHSQLEELIREITEDNTTIPSIITDKNYRVLNYSNISEQTVSSSEKLRAELERMASMHDPIEINIFNGNRFYIFYGESTLLRVLKYYPYLQLGIIAGLVALGYITFRSSKRDEQNRVWIGMAKETAHQLGTPTSSLLGWLEYLRGQQVEDFVIGEMEKDIKRLLKVVDRFSKIGSTTLLTPHNIHELVRGTVAYFKSRIPRNVELLYDDSVTVPLQATVNDALFEWVIENLLKNALDALQGKGTIKVAVYQNGGWICIDVKDSGKGISKSNQSRIFNPGYTTKTRGWGLGLSLSRRIITEYHKGRIFVAESEIDRGTTMRVMLRKL
ncbi:MAG: HAMP domain-containing sensor histidine kinase [Rikenellaceae bacterium]|nr:HAMP domain-containing sensor histidine kinase [Rikenellaceae bacterium]